MYSLRFLCVACLLFVFSCSVPPPADFYETEGIVSIWAKSPGEMNNWVLTPGHGTFSMTSKDDAGTFTFSFYLQKPGRYGVWLLAGRYRKNPQENMLPFRVMDGDGFLIERYELGLPDDEILTWVNGNHCTGEEMIVQFDKPGFYTISFEPGGREGYVIGKLHLALDNNQKPEGLGLPETRDPRTDPVRAKRDRLITIPPDYALGFNMDCDSCGDDREEDVIPGGTRELITVPVNRISETELPDKPVIWTVEPAVDLDEKNGESEISDGMDLLRKSIESIANPRRIFYEASYVHFDMDTVACCGNFGSDCDEEVYIRWMQFLAFNSIMAVSGSNNTAGSCCACTIPEAVGSVFHDLASLRNRLLPYHYSLAHRLRATGQKAVTGNGKHTRQFMLGDAFLVAPVYEKGADRRLVHLPEGTWYDYQSGQSYPGGQAWLVDAPLNRIPVFVKAGSIIPYQREDMSGQRESDEYLLVEVYGGDAGTFRLYEDDGISKKYLEGDFSTTAFRYFEYENHATFTVGASVKRLEGQPLKREIEVIFKKTGRPVRILANGKEMEHGEATGQWRYDEANRNVTLLWSQSISEKTDFVIEY